MILFTLTLDVITHSYPNLYACFAKSHGERCMANTNTRLCNLQTRSCISRKCIDHGTFKGTHVQFWIKFERTASTHISRQATYLHVCMSLYICIHYRDVYLFPLNAQYQFFHTPLFPTWDNLSCISTMVIIVLLGLGHSWDTSTGKLHGNRALNNAGKPLLSARYFEYTICQRLMFCRRWQREIYSLNIKPHLDTG